MIEQGTRVSLSDEKEYVVVFSHVIGDAEYVYLINVDDKLDIVLGKIEGDNLIDVDNPDEISMVLKSFFVDGNGAQKIADTIDDLKNDVSFDETKSLIGEYMKLLTSEDN